MRYSYVIFFIISVLCLHQANLEFCCASNLEVSGLVEQSLTYSLTDLNKFEKVKVKHNDVTEDGCFHGVFWYKGVSLHSILELAKVVQNPACFDKLTDLAIVVSNAKGEQVTLSWGEIFHFNPSDTILALSAKAIQPKKSCAKCHTLEEYRPWQKENERTPNFPKLIVTSDFYSDRSIEGITSIKVITMVSSWHGNREAKLFSRHIELLGNNSDDGKNDNGNCSSSYVDLDVLKGLPEVTVMANAVGEGKGYHGRSIHSGVPIALFLKKIQVKGDVNTVFIITAPDGYRSLLSYGELFLGNYGRRIILSNKEKNLPIIKGGQFKLILPDDLWADRWVKAVCAIEVRSTK